MRLHIKFGIDGQVVSVEKMFANGDHKHVCNPGVGADNHLGSIIFIKDYTDTMGNNSVETFIDSFGF